MLHEDCVEVVRKNLSNCDIEIMDYIEAFRYAYTHVLGREKFGIISLQDYPEAVMPFSYKAGGSLKSVVNVHVSDIDREPSYDDGIEHLMTVSDANRIVEFLYNLGCVDKLIVHCTGGVSRSAAVAAALNFVIHGDDSNIFDSDLYNPNMFVYRKLLEAFGFENKGDLFLTV